jgi:hypothetical protein
MRFIGYTNPISGMFREIALDARRIARAIKAELATGAQHREPVQSVAAQANMTNLDKGVLS